MLKKISLLLTAVLLICSMSACKKTENTPNAANSATQEHQTDVSDSKSEYTQEETTQTPTEEPTKEPFDVTKAYVNKPYSNEFALQRINEMQYIDDYSLYFLSSSDPTPVFYEHFYRERGQFNVTMNTYAYDMDNETVRKYFDAYEYSKLASAGAIKVLDSFAYTDSNTNRILYYCYYTVTHWGENDTNDTVDYYRDLITVNTKDKSITVQEKIAIRTALEIPKEISGSHDFHNVI